MYRFEEEIIFNSTTPPALGNNAFTGCPDDMRIEVPSGAEDAYVAGFGEEYYDNINETGVTKYSLRVGNVQFRSDLLSIVMGSGTASFDPETATLTLSNATIDSGTILKDHGWGRYGGCIYTALKDLTIVVKGNNSITGDIDGIYTAIGSNVTIKGDGKLTIITHSDTDPYITSMYIGLGDDPTNVDSGDLVIDGPEIVTTKEICACRNITIKGMATVNCGGRLRSNNNGNITISGDASVTANNIDMGLPNDMFTSEIYQREI